MPSIKKPRTNDSLREECKRKLGYYPSPFSHWIGVTHHFLEHKRLEAWHGFIGTLPDFPFGPLRGLLQAIIDHIYDRMAFRAYIKGCDFGARIEKGLLDVYNKAKKRISDAITEARTKIERELINPIKNKIKTEIEPKVTDLLNRIRSAETTIKDAENRINEALTDVANLKNNVASINKQVNDVRAKVDQTVRDFNSKVNDVNSRLASAKAKVDEHTKDITDLFERIKKLEGQTTEQGNLLDWFKTKIGG